MDYLSIIRAIWRSVIKGLLNPVIAIICIIIGFSLPKKQGNEKKKRDSEKLGLIIYGFMSLLFIVILFLYCRSGKCKSLLNNCSKNSWNPFCNYLY